MALLTIIIPCRNEKASIERCIHSISESRKYFNDFEIIVADGQSDDGTLDILNELSNQYNNITVVTNTQKITPVAFNIGLKHATGKYLTTIGARHFIDEKYLLTCINFIEKNEQVGCVGGISNCIESSATGMIITKAMSSAFGVGIGNFRAKKVSGYVDTVGTPLYRVDVLRKLGGFDENLVRNQDDDMSYRIIKNGYKIYQCADALVEYVTRGSFSQLFHQMYQYGYWKIYVNKKNQTITTFRQLIPPLFVLFLLFALLINILHPFSIWSALSNIPLLFYLLIGFFSSIKQSSSFPEIFSLIACFFIMHIGYGIGYLEGILNFFLLYKNPADKHMGLTR